MRLRHFPSFLVVALAACSSREEGLLLHVRLTHHASGEARTEGTARHFSNDGGEPLTLSGAYVTLSSVELIPCPSSGGSARRWLERLSPVGTAHAHSTSSPWRLGTPHVSSLERADGEPLVLGTLHPPPGRYCRASLYFGPADEDAEGLPTAVDMKGKALRLEGQVDATAQEAARPFLLESQGGAFADLSLGELTLGPEVPEQVLQLSLAYDSWLDGVDWDAPEAAAARALSNVTASASVHAATP